jgi:hypothetical protein
MCIPDIKNPGYKPDPGPINGQRQRAGEILLAAARIESEAATAYFPGQEVLREQVKELTEEARRSDLPSELTATGAGGELLPLAENNVAMMEEKALPAAALRNTVGNPDYVAVDASRHRLELASRTGSLEMGADLADTIEAGNSLEKMLAHQMAATHRATMQMIVRLNRNLEILEGLGIGESTVGFFQTVNTETCRLAGTISRLQTTFQDGALTLQKLKTGGRQTVVVQHVNVRQGGQAVVAGQVGGRKDLPRRVPRARKNGQ